MNKITKNDLILFENEIAEIFDSGEIPHPVHLSSGNEDQLIRIFDRVDSKDWVFCSWRSHYQALLKGVPPSQVKNAILTGKSIALCFPEYRFYSSAIVAGQIASATGVAKAIDRLGGDEHVWCFIGDMTSQTGIARVSIEYAINFDLPITFVIEDNNNSVCSNTRVTWGAETLAYEKISSEKIVSYSYRSKYPHAGAGNRVQF